MTSSSFPSRKLSTDISNRVDASRRIGIVRSFQADGWGVIADETDMYPFHSTALLDGSRTVAVGASVAFAIQPGHQGRWEAHQVINV